jgi:hypothetical protein
MAFPFGGHPTFAEYMKWAHSEGCKFQSGHSRLDGHSHVMTKITAPNGRHVIVVDVVPSERLSPSMVSYLDRRLRLNSPFPHAPA